MREERRAFWLGLLLALLLARSLRALLSTAFYESLATLRLNESAAWLAVLLVPALAPLLRRRSTLIALPVAAVASAALPFTQLTASHLPTAALATAACLLALPLIARHAGGLAGATVGLALQGSILAATNFHEPPAVAALLALLAGTAAFILAKRLPDAEPPAGGILAGAALGALLALEIAFLASPFALARWAGIPVWAATLASLGGLVLGATRGGSWSLWLAGGLGLLDLALFLSPIRALSIALVQAALGAAGARLAPGLGARAGSVAFALAFAPALFVLLYFRSPLSLSEWGLIVPVLAIIALFPAWQLPRAPRVGTPLLALALAGLALASAIPTPLAPAPEGRELTVVTWNVHQGFGNRGALDPAIYASALRSLDADIIFLQESDTARLSSGGLDIVRYLADDLHMRAAYGRGGPAILTKLPFAEGHATRDAEWMFEAAVELGDTTLWLESVHFGRSESLRREQAREVVAAPGSPRIVAGDFNLFARYAGNETTPYDELASRFDDAWREARQLPAPTSGTHLFDDEEGRTFRLPTPFIRIDLVLVDGAEVISADRVLTPETRLASDHLPVVARLRLPAE